MRAVPSAKDIIQQGKVFDIIYQLENKNAAVEQRGQTVTSDNLTASIGMVARFNFITTFTPVGSALRARLNDDMADQLMAVDEFGLPTNMVSFGIAEIYLPVKELLWFIPSHLAQKVADRIIGSPLSEEERHEQFVLSFTNLGLDENLFGLLERITSRTLVDEKREQPMADYIRARFRSLLERPVFEWLNSMSIVVAEIETELPGQLETNAVQVMADKRQQLLSNADELAQDKGLIPLQTVTGDLGNFFNERKRGWQAEIEELTMAKNQLIEQKTKVEGEIAQIKNIAFEPKKSRFFEGMLTGFYSNAEKEIAQLRIGELARDMYELELDNAILQLEINSRKEAINILNLLNEELSLISKPIKSVLAILDEFKATKQPQIDSFFNLDFNFHVPVGFCLIREKPHRQDDIDYFVDRMVIDESQSQTVEIIIMNIHQEVGEFWTLTETRELEQLCQGVIEEHLKPELDIWTELKERLREEQIRDRISYCVSGSAEYLSTDSAVNHDNKSWIKIIGAPIESHEALEKTLKSIGHADWNLAATNDPHRISFLQVRVGIPLHSIKSHHANKEDYIKQSNKHDEERLHTRPEWRFLPDVNPIISHDDQRLGVYVLQGVVAKRVVYEQDCYWYAPFSGPKELMGRNPKEATHYLLSHQTSFIEIVSSFYMLFHQSGNITKLAQDVLEVAENPGHFSDWLDKNSVNEVMTQLEWVRKNYDIGGEL